MSYIYKNAIVSVIYLSPSQNDDDLDSFISHFQHLLSDINKRKLSLSVFTGDFNARSSSWRSNDINTTDGLKLYSETSTNGFDQLINEPTHMQPKNSPCVNLIFTGKFWSPCIMVIFKWYTLVLTLIFPTPTISTTTNMALQKS